MKTAFLAAALVLAASAAQAQYTTAPNIYGHPEYGVTTTGPGGQMWHTAPDIYGRPEFGSTTWGR